MFRKLSFIFMFFLWSACSTSSKNSQPESTPPSPEPHKAECKELPNIKHGTWNQKAPIKSGFQISSSCSSGFHGDPSPTAQCENGKWKNTAGSCTAKHKKECKSLPRITNGEWIEKAPIKSGVTISSTCSQGFHGNPSPTAECNDGKWEKEEGQCIVDAGGNSGNSGNSNEEAILNFSNETGISNQVVLGIPEGMELNYTGINFDQIYAGSGNPDFISLGYTWYLLNNSFSFIEYTNLCEQNTPEVQIPKTKSLCKLNANQKGTIENTLTIEAANNSISISTETFKETLEINQKQLIYKKAILSESGKYRMLIEYLENFTGRYSAYRFLEPKILGFEKVN